MSAADQLIDFSQQKRILDNADMTEHNFGFFFTGGYLQGFRLLCGIIAEFLNRFMKTGCFRRRIRHCIRRIGQGMFLDPQYLSDTYTAGNTDSFHTFSPLL